MHFDLWIKNQQAYELHQGSNKFEKYQNVKEVSPIFFKLLFWALLNYNLRTSSYGSISKPRPLTWLWHIWKYLTRRMCKRTYAIKPFSESDCNFETHVIVHSYPFFQVMSKYHILQFLKHHFDQSTAEAIRLTRTALQGLQSLVLQTPLFKTSPVSELFSLIWRSPIGALSIKTMGMNMKYNCTKRSRP